MSDPRETPAARDAYLRGVSAFVDGRLDEARGDLESAADAGIPEAALALAKLHLEQSEGAAAARWLSGLLEDPPADPCQRAYLLLLIGSALGHEGRREEALRHLDEVSTLDRRLEPAARALRRRLQRGRPPLLRL